MFKAFKNLSVSIRGPKIHLPGFERLMPSVWIYKFGDLLPRSESSITYLFDFLREWLICLCLLVLTGEGSCCLNFGD